jgi:hypothetical protein
MAENSENIEAKLCAYVEGDLDEEGRAEIERHLDAHPNHRRLLAELTATRDLLRYLPRENAPTDLAETFNAQLERSALLDGPSADPAAPTIHAANLLPRLLALAAIVVLGAGLGAVVYFGLPRGTSSTNYARTSPEMAGATDRDSIATTLESATQPAVAHAERMLKAGSGGAGEALPTAGASASRRAMKAGKGGLGPAVADGFAGKQGVYGGSLAARSEPVYVFVCASDLAAASREVTQQLAASNIAWQPADASAQVGQLQQPQALPNQVASNAAPGFVDPARVELDNALKKKQFLQSQVAQAGQYADQSPAPARPADEANGALASAEAKDKAASENKAPANQTAAAPAVPGPAAAPVATAAPAPKLESDKELEAPQQPQAQPQQQELAAGTAQPQPEQQKALAQAQQQQQSAQNARAEQVAVYRAKMTRDQVLNLGTALNRPTQQVELIADDQRLQRANMMLQQQQQQQQLQLQQHQQYARQNRDEAALQVNRSAVPQVAGRAAAQVDAAAAAAATPVTQPSDVVQREEVARAEAGARGAGKIAPSGGAAVADAAKGNAPAPSAAPAPARPQSPVAMKAGPDSKAVYSQAKTTEGQQPVAATTPPPPAALPAPAAVAPATPATPAAQVAAKQSPINSRAGGERQQQLMAKVAPRARLRVTVDELRGPDASPTSETDLAEDGTIALPKLEQRVRVEGLTRAQAQQAIHDAYKAANVIDDPNVTVEPIPAPAPDVLAQRVPNDADRNAQQQQQPRVQAAVTTTPAVQSTQPAGQPAAPGAQEIATEVGQPQAAPTSGPSIADEPLDVVILVQRSATTGGSTEPGATTPAESAPPNAAAVEPSPATPTAEAAKPAPPAEPAAPNAAAPNAAENPASPAPTSPPSPPELPAK